MPAGSDSTVSLSPSLRDQTPANGDHSAAARELKFLLNEPEAREVETRVMRTLLPDPHSDPALGGMYAINSLCCDDRDLGVFHRDVRMQDRKFRVRRYGAASRVFLECKWSKGGTVRKRRVEAPMAVLSNAGSLESDDVSHAWFLHDLRSLELLPVCRVRYLRRALFGACSEGPMRVTFDRSLRGALVDGWSMDSAGDERSLLEGLVVCEFKFTDTMPAPLKEVISSMKLEPSGCSKYRTCVRAFAPEFAVDLSREHPPSASPSERSSIA